MAILHQMSFTSRLAQHRHIMWTDGRYAGSQFSIPEYEKARVMHMPVSSFNQRMAPLKYGRFYPAQILKTSGNPPAGIFRVTAIQGGEFRGDFNHPLAGKEVCLEKDVCRSDFPPLGEPRMLLDWGGIDAPLNEGDTDYAIPDAFDCEDPSDDAIFYRNPRKVIHVDRTCVSRIMALYRNLIKPGHSVLDLMSSWRSHLPSQTGGVTGLGMNAEEMADNAQLKSYIVHDLNRSPRLSFPDGCFDVVVNTLSIEYLREPHQVLTEARRVLKPGGMVIVTFSNRFFPPKTARFWIQLHPAERIGWVLQVLRKAGFSDCCCYVERGLKRSPDDRYAAKVREMDPLFAVWGIS